MIRCLAVCILLLAAPIARASSCFAHVSTHGTVTSPSMNTTGATILLAGMSSYSGYNQVLNDSVGNRDWNTGQEYDANLGPYNYILYKPTPATNAAYTFSIPTTTGLFFMSSTVWACSGTTTDHPLAQQVGISTTGASTTFQVAPVTPLEVGDLIFTTLTCNTNSLTASIDSGFATPVVTNTVGYVATASSWLSAGSTSPVNPTWTTNFAPCIASTAVFKAIGATAPPDIGQHITTVVGTGHEAFGGDGGLAINAFVDFPGEIVKTSNGLICFTDVNNNRVRCFNPTAGTLTAPWVGSVSIAPGHIATVVGSGTLGFVYNVAPLSAAMGHPVGLSIDSSDCLYIADQQNSRILKVCPGSNLVVIAGGDNGGGINSGCRTVGSSDDFARGFAGDGGLATLGLLSCPQGVAVDPTNSYIVITDGTNYRNRIVNLTGGTITRFGVSICSGCIQTVSGSGPRACVIGATALTSIVGLNIGGVDFDASGNMYQAMYDCNQVWKTNTAGVPTAIAGTANVQGYSGDGGLATSAQMRYPFTLKRASNGDIVITDTGNSVIRFIDHVTGNISTIAGNFTLYPFYAPTVWNSGGYCCDNGAANVAGIGYPIGLYRDPSNNNLYISALLNSRINMMFTVAPTSTGSQLVGGPGGSQWLGGSQVK